MMRVCRFVLILSILCFDQILYANAISVEISSNLSENVTGLLGDNGTQLKCSFIEKNVVFTVSLMALNRSKLTFETIAVFIPDRISRLTLNGQYLKERVTLTTITKSSMTAFMTFNQLMCIDGTFYKCNVIYLDFENAVNEVFSNNISISVQVPPSKPDSVSIVYTPEDPSLNSTKQIEYSNPLPSSSLTSNEIQTFSEFQTAEQNNTPNFDTTASGTSNDEFSSDNRHRITMYPVEQTTSAQGLAEGDTITVVCSGDVGKPPAKHVFEKYLDGKIVPIQYTVTSTLISDMSENCTYYRTSNLTFKVTAKDNNAVIRCVVNSSMSEPDMFVDTEAIQVYYYDAQSTTFRNTVGPLSKVENTAVIVVGTVCGLIILVLVIVFGVIKNKKFRSLLMTKPSDRSADYVNTTQQQNPSLYEGVGQDLDVHNYEQLSRMGHLYNNTNYTHN